MPSHLESIRIKGELLERDVVVSRAQCFYEVNGYTLALPGGGEERAGLLRYERGGSEPGVGWWTSNMAELPARVELMWREESGELEVVCRVDTSGQHMTQGDLGFWRGEVEAVREFVLGSGGGEPPDLREAEARRAHQISSGTWAQSLKLFIVSFMVLFMVGVVLERLGLLSF